MDKAAAHRPKILLADDHQLILDSLSLLLSNRYEVHTVGSFRLLAQKIRSLSPDLVILDIEMPDGNGFQLAHQLLEAFPLLRVMFLSMYSECSYRKRATALGACAYLTKCSSAKEVLDAIQIVLRGGKYLRPSPLERTTKGSQVRLTPRQTEVLRLISRGCSTKEIAHALHISVRTVDFHRIAIMERINRRSTALMTRYAIEQGIA